MAFSNVAQSRTELQDTVTAVLNLAAQYPSLANIALHHANRWSATALTVRRMAYVSHKISPATIKNCVIIFA